MSDFAKTIVVVLITASMSSAATISALSSDIANISRAVIKIDGKMERFDDRLRAVEIGQAGYIASN